MISQPKGLVAFTSASGAAHYMFGPAYGVAKAGTDKMAADIAVDFKDQNVAAVSIWMGTLLTQCVRVTQCVRDIVAADPGKFGHVLDNAETPELTGHIIWELYNDPDLMELSGRTLVGAQLAAKYGIADER
jgi:NAD(P)-dependent dehydrogenase (short-subunit alcohol dehydrogenase family)